MKVYINLLHESELRYQGLVGRRFIVLAAVITSACILVLIGGFVIFGYLSQRQELKDERAQWKKTEAAYRHYLLLQKEQASVKTVVDELEGWNHARLPMADLLLDLQRTVAPYPIQFMRVTVDSELVMVQPPVPKEKVKLDEGDEEPKDSAAAPHALVKPPAKPPATPARRFHVVITGRVSGEQGHTAVVAFDEDLQKKSPLAPVFETVRLQGISRVSGDNQRNEQNFTIECLTPLRKYE